MYFKDKTEIYKIRFTLEQAQFINSLSKVLDCSRSEVVRKIIDTYRLRGCKNEDK